MANQSWPVFKRNARQWRLLDVLSAAFFAAVLVFFFFVLTWLGDSPASPGRKPPPLSSAVDPQQRSRAVESIEAGRVSSPIQACTADYVDHMPCEDPRINSQLSREMNYYRERHCPVPEQTPLCLIPPPEGYRVPVQWPESLNKVRCLFVVFLVISFVSLAFFQMEVGFQTKRSELNRHI